MNWSKIETFQVSETWKVSIWSPDLSDLTITMKTILFTYPKPINDEIQLIKEMFALGLNELVLRKPKWNEKEYLAFINQFTSEEKKKITICDNPTLAFEEKLNGLHCSNGFYDGLTQIEKHKIHLKIKQNGQLISISAHHPREWQNRKGHFNQLYLCPIFPSISKPGYAGNWDLEWMQTELKQEQEETIVALGGIQEDKLKQVEEIGFDGIGILGSIWNEPNNAVSNFKSLLKEIQND